MPKKRVNVIIIITIMEAFHPTMYLLWNKDLCCSIWKRWMCQRLFFLYCSSCEQYQINTTQWAPAVDSFHSIFALFCRCICSVCVSVLGFLIMHTACIYICRLFYALRCTRRCLVWYCWAQIKPAQVESYFFLYSYILDSCPGTDSEYCVWFQIRIWALCCVCIRSHSIA